MNALRIDTKERGIIPLGTNLLGTQKWVMREIVSGLEDGIHDFEILKARQLGISTFSLALDLYWLGRHKALTGAMITHDEPARDSFRSTLELYYSGLPDKWRFPTKQHNRNQWVFRHGTKLLYKVAGTKEKGSGTLGRSSSATFVHATECAFWGDQDGFLSLKNSLAQMNPHRLYIWESTANGFNGWHDACQRAKKSAASKFIFVSWWANEFYRLARGTPLYNVYWGKNGRCSTEELTYTKEVKHLYGVDIDDEMWAWYRYWHAEQQPDERMMMQEFPHTEEMAFVSSGAGFFSATSVTALHKEIYEKPEPRYMKLILGDDMRDTRFVECNDRIANFKLWHDSEPDGVYVMGADPAFGSSEYANNYAIEIYRCYGDKMVQVAEFADPSLNTRQFAWAIAYLCGAYQPCTLNLEVNGPGQAVLAELQSLKRMQNFGTEDDKRIMREVMSKVRDFMYRKYDNLGGAPSAIHTVTTFQTKERYCNLFRDLFEAGLIEINSEELAEEMRTIVRQGGSSPQADNDGADDLFVATGLAVMAWVDQIRTQLIIRNKNYAVVESEERLRDGSAPQVQLVSQRLVQNYLRGIGFGEDERMKAMPGVKFHIPQSKGRPL